MALFYHSLKELAQHMMHGACTGPSDCDAHTVLAHPRESYNLAPFSITDMYREVLSDKLGGV